MGKRRLSGAGRRDRRGGSMVWPLAALCGIVVTALGGVGYFLWSNGEGGGEDTALLHRVSVGPFEHYVIERGDLESSNNEEIRCQVRARAGSPGTAILKIVPAGTYVRQGDFLIQFDDSALQSDLVQQRITAGNARATKIQSETAVETAKAALNEYVNGTSKQELELARSEVFVAEENLRRAEEVLRFSERLASRNYVTSVQLDADRFAVKKAAKDLEAAQTKVDVLKNHTYHKMVAQLKGEIAKAEALLTAAIAADGLEARKLADIEDQIRKCKVTAPADGQVVYATQNERQREEQIVIEEGAVIREGQTVIRLPDTKRMQVRALVNESRINLVRPGAPARIELDANPGTELEGIVETIDAFPLSRRWSSSIKEYGAVVKILTPAEGLRPGLRAKVRIFVHAESDVLTVPVQSVVERGGQHFCIAKRGDHWEARSVEIGANNDQFVVVQGGLAAGDDVAVDPRPYLDKVDLPAPKETPRLAGAGRAGGRQAGNGQAGNGQAGNGQAGNGHDRRPKSGPPRAESGG